MPSRYSYRQQYTKWSVISDAKMKSLAYHFHTDLSVPKIKSIVDLSTVTIYEKFGEFVEIMLRNEDFEPWLLVPYHQSKNSTLWAFLEECFRCPNFKYSECRVCDLRSYTNKYRHNSFDDESEIAVAFGRKLSPQMKLVFLNTPKLAVSIKKGRNFRYLMTRAYAIARTKSSDDPSRTQTEFINLLLRHKKDMADKSK